MSGEPRYALEDLLRVMQRLRDPEGGCPWDLKQDFTTIVPSTLEECYELADAIERGDLPHVAEELGDVLFQVIFYCQLGDERQAFDFAGVVDSLVHKLIRRHPHVFAGGEIEGRTMASVGVDTVKQNWEAIKRIEREGKNRGGTLDDVPLALPALPRAQKIQKRAAGVGFDWPEVEAVFAVVDAELAELREAFSRADRAAIEDETGDVLFSMVNLARHLRLDAEAALRRATHKFEGRFRTMEAEAAADGVQLGDESAEALERRWSRAKSTKANL